MRRVTITVDFSRDEDYEALVSRASRSLCVIGSEYSRRSGNSVIRAKEEYIKPLPDKIETINGVDYEVYKSKI